MVNSTQTEFIPFREPFWRTVLRTAIIAMIPALILCVSTHRWAAFAAAFLGGLWFSFGGHWAEMLWLTGVRHRLPRSPLPQRLGRIIFWFLSGMALGIPLGLTVRLMAPRFEPPGLVVFGVAFVLIELTVHYLLLHRRGRPSFYDSAG